MHSQAKTQLVATARNMLEHLDQGRIDRADDIMRVDTAIYSDPARFKTEKNKIFHRLPLMLAASCELPAAGDYKALEVANIPILLTRGKNGVVRTFLNSCTHRGSELACGTGRAARFTCPYHGWTFGSEGQLIGVASQDQYGSVDKTGMGLVAFSDLRERGTDLGDSRPALQSRHQKFFGRNR